MIFYANSNTNPVKWKGYLNATPLHAACENSHLAIVKKLIERGADILAEYVCPVIVLVYVWMYAYVHG